MGTIQVTPGESGRLIVQFAYSTERVAVIKAVSGRRWHQEGKYWTVPQRVADLPSAKEEKKLPLVLSQEEVKRLLRATSNLMEEAVLSVVYFAGLRMSEAIQLKARNVLSGRGQIRVEGGKGKKDRYTVLADETLRLLRRYYRVYRPGEWLFPGKVPTHTCPGERQSVSLSGPRRSRKSIQRLPSTRYVIRLRRIYWKMGWI